MYAKPTFIATIASYRDFYLDRLLFVVVLQTYTYNVLHVFSYRLSLSLVLIKASYGCIYAIY